MKNVKAVVFGARDPEQIEAERMFKNHGWDIYHAGIDGVRCHPGNAYKADRTVFKTPPDVVCLFECSIPPFEGFEPKVVVIDHHRPGDPGYDCEAGDYWRGSSLGQACKLLHVEPTEHLRIIAALDHCPRQAMAGSCPGVNRLLAAKGRRAQIDEEHKPVGGYIPGEGMYKTIEEIIISARIEILYSPFIEIGWPVRDLRSRDCGLDSHGGWTSQPGYSASYLCAIQAALELKESILMEHQDYKSGPRKLYVNAAFPSIVKEFMENWGPAQGLTGIYGNPQRGYAGGYIK